MITQKQYHFPYYRKLKNGKIHYKISSLDLFEELQMLGQKRLYHRIEAPQYPEKLKIIDMIALADENYLESSEEEWKEFLMLID